MRRMDKCIRKQEHTKHAAVVKVDRVTGGRYIQDGKTCKKAQACA
jgi:hypothetical protein